MKAELSLILGGARSGKSRIAEQRACASGLSLVYLATARAQDGEMRQRIDRHIQDRAAQSVEWSVVEEPIELGRVVGELSGNRLCILIDCLTLWLSNCLHAGCWPEEKQGFLDALASTDAEIIMVSNETGLGVVPLGEMSRHFVDESGFLHQQLGQICQRVTLVVAGLTTELKA